MSVLTFIRSSVIVLLTTLHLGPGVLQSEADSLTAGDSPMTSPNPSQKQMESSAKAHASASASASSSTRGNARGCRAESSSTAEARAGDQYVRDEDHDEAVDEDGGCSAHAESKASARSGPKE